MALYDPFKYFLCCVICQGRVGNWPILLWSLFVFNEIIHVEYLSANITFKILLLAFNM